MEGGKPPPQLPFSRNTNTASTYGHPLPPAPNGQAPRRPPPSGYPADRPPPFKAEHMRRNVFDIPYNQHPNYQAGHSRHQSSSSGRGMPPPSSPQQQGPGSIQHAHGPPHPRAPPVTVGPPAAFPSGRELPPPVNRPPSTAGSNMSISSILGGPTPGTRDQIPSQYTSPINTSVPPPMYGSAPHASPRVNSAANEYTSFGRPQTPELRYEQRDHRANSAGSPPAGPVQYGTPDHRHGTPQQYGPRPTQNQIMHHQERRMSNMSMPPRPNSQPTAYNASISHSGDRPGFHGEQPFAGRRVDHDPRGMETRGDSFYQRSGAFDPRRDPALDHLEREQEREREREFEREREIARERDTAAMMLLQREREVAEREQAVAMQEQTRPGMHGEYPHQMPPRNQLYGRQPDSRDQGSWMRHGHDQPRIGFEPPQYDRPPQSYPQHGNGYDYPRSSAPHHLAYDPVPHHDQRDHRYPPAPHHQGLPQSQESGSQFERSYEERMARGAQQQQQQHSARHQSMEIQARAMQPQSSYGGSMPPNPQYHQHDSPQRRQVEEVSQMMQPQQSQRSHLSVQDNRRGGRISPIPQAVQGAQVQQPGPAGEPGIKTEFGRIFHGIGSGVGATMSMPSPVAGSPAGGVILTGPRREDLDSPSAHNSPIDNSGSTMPRPVNRRRKIKDDDESSTGRQTPNGRGKRAKLTDQLSRHGHHHHQRPDPSDNLPPSSIQSLTPFKSTKGTNGNVSPSNGERSIIPHHHHHNVRNHHHHQSIGPRVASSMNTFVPIPKYEVNSQAIIDAAAPYPRVHLGNGFYIPYRTLYRSSSSDKLPSERAFANTNRGFPNFEDRINSTFTIRISRTFLLPDSRAQITARRNLWGTDVYSDDSDIVAACIHQGWICGKWAPDVDPNDLNLYPPGEGDGVQPELDIDVGDRPDEYFDHPPVGGPMPIRRNRDLIVTILVLGCLQKYSSKIRYGIMSREWGGTNTAAHDGLSYLIMNMQWHNAVDGKDPGKVAAKRYLDMQNEEKAIDKQEQEADQYRERKLGSRNGNSRRRTDHGNGEDTVMGESHMRGDGAQHILNGGEIKGVGMGSWWKGTPRGSSKRIDNTNKPQTTWTTQEDQEMTGYDTLSRSAESLQAQTDLKRDTSVSSTINHRDGANTSENSTLETHPPNASASSQVTSPNNGITEGASAPESIAVEASGSAHPQPMLTDTPDTGEPAVQPTETSNHQIEVIQEVQPIGQPNDTISASETSVKSPAATTEHDNVEPAESRIEEQIPLSVPVVEVPTAAPETQAQAQALPIVETPSPLVEVGTAVDADSSASAPAPAPAPAPATN